MANKPLKSIKFPDLPDTYTVPVVDNTLAVTGAAADAKKTGDGLAEKVDKVSGKGLSTNDFTNDEKTKLANIEAGANKTITDPTLTQSGQAADANAVGVKVKIANCFELGNIAIGNTWTYSDSTSRVRLKPGLVLRLQKDSIISVKPGIANVVFFAGGALNDGTLTYAGNWTKKYIVPADGEYTLLLRYAPESDINDISEIVKAIEGLSVADIIASQEDGLYYGKRPPEKITTLLLSESGMPQFDTKAKTLTIPNDTLLIYGTRLRGIGPVHTSLPNLTIGYSTIGTTAIKFYYNILTETARAVAFNIPKNHGDVLIATFRTNSGLASIGCPYIVDGKLFGIDLNQYIDSNDLNYAFNQHVKGINHRGFHTAPENTLAAVKLSRKNGYKYVEVDIHHTADDVPVLLHDDSINRTARTATGESLTETINISQITYEQALEYDFGVYKGDSYAGTKIPTFEEFMFLCKRIGVCPYIELKDLVKAKANNLITIVKRCDMLDKVTWISFSDSMLRAIGDIDNTARLGLLASNITQAVIDRALIIKQTANNVFIDASGRSDEEVQLCMDAGIPLEVYTIDDINTIKSLNPYISGVTSNNFNAGYRLHQLYLE